MIWDSRTKDEAMCCIGAQSHPRLEGIANLRPMGLEARKMKPLLFWKEGHRFLRGLWATRSGPAMPRGFSTCSFAGAARMRNRCAAAEDLRYHRPGLIDSMTARQ